MNNGSLETLLLLSACQGFLISGGLLFFILKGKPSNFFLGIITLVISLEIGTIWAVRTGYTNEPGRFPFWILGSYLLLPPALYLMGKINTVPNFRMQRWHAYLFLPALIEILIEFYSDYTNRYTDSTISFTQSSLWNTFTEILPIIGLVAVLIFVGRDIRGLQTHLKNLGIRHPHLVKVQIFYLLFSVFALLWILEAFFRLSVFRITIALLCGFVFLIAYISFYNPNFLLPPPFLRKKSSSSSPQSGKDEHYLENIRKAFEADKLYLRPKLTLKIAAEQLGMPTRKLSEVINTYFEIDFSNFVNSYRVDEVIRKVEEGELSQKTLLAVALESGFNSKSSFNQAFKDLKGKSPSAYFSNK